MKKTIVSALTTALVVGAASTTFAAANPFSDVPSDHWAYDAVTQLATDGIIEGYGDTTFQGDKNITRYEMAQMIAKAMAKQNVPANDKALIDKLAAEFADELNNLGVRVSNLEKHADMVKWTGKAEYTYKSQRHEHQPNNNENSLLLRLEPQAEVNDHWTVNARLDATTYLNRDDGYADDEAKTNGEDDSKVTLKRVWAQGDYDNFTAKFGKFAPIDDDSIFDTTFSGAEVSFGKDVTFTVGAGRHTNDFVDSTDSDKWHVKNSPESSAANYQYAGLGYAADKIMAGVDFHHLNYDGIACKDNGKTTDNANIWLVKGSYDFDGTSSVNGFYAQNSEADFLDKAASIEYDYKGADEQNAGTWGAWLAYRHLGMYAAPFSTFDAVQVNQKAWEIGADYAPFKNVIGTLRYARGKDLKDDDSTVQTLFGQIDFLF